MEKTRLSNKGQIVIPKAVRVFYGWKAGAEFVIEHDGDGIRLSPVNKYPRTRIEDVKGCLGYRGPRKTLKDMEAAIAKGAREGK